MEFYTKITQLNDFIFCPRSLYFHELYGNTTTEYYHTSSQRKGLAAHKSIENKTYSTRKNVLQGTDVYSEKYKLQGKIDIFDIKTETLTERKKKIKKIYDGYIFQLYAQYFALTEMGYIVSTIRFHSLENNKIFPIPRPEEDAEMLQKFESTINALHSFDLTLPFTANSNKCKHCIYKEICDYYTEEQIC